MAFKKSLLALSLTTLVACGGGGSNDGGSNVVVDNGPGTDTGNPQPTPVETAISGKAIKGTLSNATVTVYKYVDGEAVEVSSDEILESTIVSDENGSYTFTLLDYDGPVKVEIGVSADGTAPTTMICDAPAGCGDVVFGQAIDLTATAPDFMLTSVSSVESGEALTVNVSPLTHIATALVESSDDVTPESIQDSVSLVANTFGIQGDITTLEPTALEDNAAVAGEDNDEELRYGLINAGIASALYSGDTDIAESLELAVADIVANDGQLLVVPDGDDSFEFSLTEILDGASDAAEVVATNIQNDSSITDADSVIDDLAQVETNLENESESQELLAGEDGRTDDDVEIVTEGDAVAKAQAMVNDVRVFANLFDADHESNTAIVSQGEALQTLVSDASDMIELEEEAFVILSELSDVMMEIEMMDTEQTVFNLAEFTTAADLTGSVTLDAENYDFQVDATNPQGQAVKLNANLSLADDGQTLTFAVQGELESDTAKVMLAEGSGISVVLSDEVTQMELEDGDVDVNIVSGAFNLDVTMAQKSTDAIVNPVTFVGKLNADLVMVDMPTIRTHYFYEEDWQSNYLDNSLIFYPENEQSPFPSDLTLSGQFASAEGQSISATFTVAVNELDAYEAPGFMSGIGSKTDAPVMLVDVSVDGNTVIWRTNEDVTGNDFGAEYTYEDLNEGQDLNHFHLTNTRYSDGEVVSVANNWLKLTEVDGLKTTDYRYIQNSHNSGSSFHYLYRGTITEVDNNDDGVVDGYAVTRQQVSRSDSEDYSLETSFDSDGNVVVDVEDVNISEYTEDYWNYRDYLEAVSRTTNFPGLELSNAYDFFELVFIKDRDDNPVYDVWDTDSGVLLSSIEDLDAIVLGEDEQQVAGYVIQQKQEEALTVSINDADTAVTFDVLGNEVASVSVSSSDQGELIYTAKYETEWSTIDLSINGFTIVNTTTQEEMTVFALERTFSSGGELFHREAELYYITPSDVDGNGTVDDNEYSVFSGIGYEFNGLTLVNYDGIEVEYYPSNYPYTKSLFSALYGIDIDSLELADNTASMIFQNIHQYALDKASGIESYLGNDYLSNLNGASLPDVGGVSFTAFIEEATDTSVFVAGSDNVFDVSITSPANTSVFEDESTFLDLSAALSVSVTLQDYEVDLMLSGQRTELEDGQFEFNATYQTPDTEGQRSFKVMVESLDSDSIIATNAEGVVLVMSEPADVAEGEDEVLGEIRVGAQAIVAAQIIRRDGVVLIQYNDADGTIESL